MHQPPLGGCTICIDWKGISGWLLAIFWSQYWGYRPRIGPQNPAQNLVFLHQRQPQQSFWCVNASSCWSCPMLTNTKVWTTYHDIMPKRKGKKTSFDISRLNRPSLFTKILQIPWNARHGRWKVSDTSYWRAGPHQCQGAPLSRKRCGTAMFQGGFSGHF